MHRNLRCAKPLARDAPRAETSPCPTGGEHRTPTPRAIQQQKKMTFTTAALGSLSGLFIGVFSNGVRKLPLFRRPWDHLILMGIMGYGGHKYPQLEAIADAEERLAPPLMREGWREPRDLNI